MFKNLHIKDYDFKLIFVIIAINTLGILAINSANPSNVPKQIVGSIFGLFLMVLVSLFDYSLFLKFYWLWYFVDFALLLLVEFAGKNAGGAQRWFEIAGIRFQPSETAKILLIIFFAQFIMKYREKVNTFRFLISFMLLAAVPLFLIFSQPDMSTTIVITVTICSILLVAGLSWKIIIGAFAVFIPSLIIFLSIVLKEGQDLINSYQRKRILSFIYPEKYVDDAYQQTNSVIAIGSGQVWGKGYNTNVISSLKNGNFIIAPDTDFIFSVIGEELGFMGCIFVIFLLFFIVFECFLIARRARDIAGRVIACAMGTLIGIQTFFNIGVTTFILPNTGLPLPFVSYGLTSLVSLYIGMGFVINIRFRSGAGSERKEGIQL
ncbi:MAG: rod shape-determining protein RodA [Lachnospiraceae bacterium]|nr:rod shape-determining protein RodA [Lachnospiraceae bacterium]